MAKEGSLGALLQGVSQQPPKVRPDGKVTEQINFISDVVQGLTARPALVEKATVTGFSNDDYSFMDVEIEGTHYIIGFRPGSIIMWDAAGNVQTVTEQDASALAYIGAEMRPYVFEDKLYLANRNTVVQKSTVIDTSGVLSNVGMTYCLGGLFSKTYTLRIRYNDGTVIEGTYTAPDGTTAGDADKTSAEYIIGELKTSIEAHVDFKAGTVLTRSGRFLHVAYTSEFTMRSDDGGDGSALRTFTTFVKDIADLPETAAHGFTVRVTNADEGTEDDYYMRFNSDVTSTLGDGLGDSGVWEEWYNAGEVVSFDLTTMPHVITKTGTNTFSLERGNWASRTTGDETTNPFLDFVGYPIRDIGGFQSRLVVVAGPWCVMSQTNKPLNFFKKSALSELSTDPISISSTQEGTVRLDWIIPFDRDLVLMSDPGAGQYVITGFSKITPDTAAMTRTTAFEMRGGAKPVETGRTIVFPFKSGKFSGINEFFTNDEVTTNGADTLTESLDRYVVGLVDHMVSSTNFNMVAFKTDDTDHSNTIWMYKYLWQNADKLQSSWSKWQFPYKVEHFFFEGSELFVVMAHPITGNSTTSYVIAALDLDIPLDPVTGYHICLDRQTTQTANVSHEVTLPYAGAKFAQSTGCKTPGREVTPTNETTPDVSGNVTYTFEAETVPDGAQVVAGLCYERSVTPTMPQARGYDGKPIPRAQVTVTSFLVNYEETGYLRAVMDAKYRSNPMEFIVDWFPLDQDTDDTEGNGLRTGTLSVPWGERSDWSELTLTSQDIRPTTILSIDWVGQVMKGSKL